MSNNINNTNLYNICKHFLELSETENLSKEIEVRFGTKGIAPISRLNYNNTIRKLLSYGFYTKNSEGTHILKIVPEMLDAKTGKIKSSNVRISIEGTENISTFCRTDELTELSNFKRNISAMQKNRVYNNNEPFPYAEFGEFNFRVAYADERQLKYHNTMIQTILNNWKRKIGRAHV